MSIFFRDYALTKMMIDHLTGGWFGIVKTFAIGLFIVFCIGAVYYMMFMSML